MTRAAVAEPEQELQVFVRVLFSLETTHDEVRSFVLGELRALIDDLGVARATELIAEEAVAWHAERRSCPWCGFGGLFHDTSRGGP